MPLAFKRWVPMRAHYRAIVQFHAHGGLRESARDLLEKVSQLTFHPRNPCAADTQIESNGWCGQPGASEKNGDEKLAMELAANLFTADFQNNPENRFSFAKDCEAKCDDELVRTRRWASCVLVGRADITCRASFQDIARPLSHNPRSRSPSPHFPSLPHPPIPLSHYPGRPADSTALFRQATRTSMIVRFGELIARTTLNAATRAKALRTIRQGVLYS